MTPTFYRKELPSNAISFSSGEGRMIFESAMSRGGAFTFFALIEQLQTQPEPAYCGLTTLVIVLNALAVDPRRLWKGPWRWYDERFLNCCVDLEKVKETGISFDTFACLAKCQGLGVEATRGSDSTVDEFRQVVRHICTTSSPSDYSHPTSFLIVSYTRKVIGQTGSGHFSPIGAYDEVSDSVLLLDTARFKYGPHWVKLELLFKALLPLDPSTGKSRGYMVLSYDGLEVESDSRLQNTHLSNLPRSVLFRPQISQAVREYKQFVKKQGEKNQCEIDLQSVLSFWTQNYTNDTYVWELIKPQLKPVDSDEIKLVESIQELVRVMIDETILDSNLTLKRQECTSVINECCSASSQILSQRYIQINPVESIFIVYLASLSEETRRSIVKSTMQKSKQYDNTVGDQLLAEIELIAYAVEASDME
ncbi:hypothetical protein HJC23_013045 [Cyclotella cryptica]|uniref:glutathione gamma-glutamylcysteinyltransferase n=1 Tax=Cyclotella cryptica TaxID=29204 RepID=A0ABD3Q741_9STRA|eukprot:CCRYP_008080-RB/>CCRYP_008080-RB protein AED:0.07 eAED:0.07 QI:128/1/1/1/0.75/0.6/5/72/420